MKDSKSNINKIETLHSIIDELRLESRKIEYSSALERLTKRVDKIEEQIKVLVDYVKER
jgi:coenzyme F420-reducing hydrogenase delta subunit